MGRASSFLKAVAVAVLAYCVYLARAHVRLPDWYWQARLPPGIEAIDAADPARLKQVLFGGDPWLLQCDSGRPFSGQHLPRPFRSNPAFHVSRSTLRGLVRFGVVDCEHELPSNKTLVAKLGLVRRTQPLLIFAAGGGNPKQLPAKSATSAYAINAWVKPKAQPKVHTATSQQALAHICAGRRPCLLSALDSDSAVLEQLAAKYRTLEVVAVGSDANGKAALSWGRGDEVGETLEDDEAQHLGQRASFVKPDPEMRAGKGKQRESAPRLLRGFGGSEDLPSLSLFVERALAASGDEGFIRSNLPQVLVAVKKPEAPKGAKASKATPTDNAERQRKRARKLAEAAAKAEAEAEAKAKADSVNREEAQRLREQAARARMAAEEAAAGNLVEEVEDEDEDEEDDDEEDDDAIAIGDDDDEVLNLDD